MTTNDPTPIPLMRDELIDLSEVAATLKCSKRHVLRLAARGLIPQPVHLGALLRWQRTTLDSWIEQGCPPSTIRSQQRDGRAAQLARASRQSKQRQP